jgi:nucleoside-diphosphate-sugar epimerase
MQKLTLPDPAVVPPGSTVLVTGANGLIGSHIVDQLLWAGYDVRATVRRPSKCTWMRPLYEGRHGPGRFELVQVSDFSRPDAWDAAVQGVAGICHVAGAADLAIQNVDEVLEAERVLHLGLLEAARRAGTVRAFVYTGTAWAAFSPDAKKKEVLTEWTWNDEAVRVARSDVAPEQKGIAPFMALKTLEEQEIWAWVRKERPAFTFNVLLLDNVIGNCLDPEHQGFPSTTGMVRSVWDGTRRELLNMIAPQWHIDTRDVGRLFVAALSTPGVDRERIYGFSDKCSWAGVVRIVKELYPGKEIVPVEDHGENPSEVPNGRGADLLRGLGRPGWTSLRESVKSNIESVLEAEGRSL